MVSNLLDPVIERGEAASSPRRTPVRNVWTLVLIIPVLGLGMVLSMGAIWTAQSPQRWWPPDAPSPEEKLAKTRQWDQPIADLERTIDRLAREGLSGLPPSEASSPSAGAASTVVPAPTTSETAP